jgi:hypothetical protein
VGPINYYYCIKERMLLLIDLDNEKELSELYLMRIIGENRRLA